MTPPTIEEILDFEEQHFTTRTARKAEAVRRHFGLSHPAYVQRLLAAVRTREGVEHNPLLARQVQDRAVRCDAQRKALITRRAA